MIKSFFAALSFISRLPVPARLSQGLEIEQYQRSIVTFPLVGLLLGAIAGAVVYLLQPWCGVPLAALFGALALAGRSERVQELFRLGYGLDSADAAEREAAVKTEGEKNHG